MKEFNDMGKGGKFAAIGIAPLMILCCAAPLFLPALIAGTAGWFTGVGGMVLVFALAMAGLLAYRIHRRRRERRAGRETEMGRDGPAETDLPRRLGDP